MKTYKIIITLAAIVIGIVVPYLEINHTHVFNPHWPSHARLHEVWQLITNTCISGLCLWLAWRENLTRLSATIMLMIVGSFMIAFLISKYYGGSMLHSDGTQLAVFGINVAVIIMAGLLIALLPIVVLPTNKTDK